MMLLALVSQQRVQRRRASWIVGFRAAQLIVDHFLQDFSTCSHTPEAEGLHQQAVYEGVVAQDLRPVSFLCLSPFLVPKVAVTPYYLAARASFQESSGNHNCRRQQGLRCLLRWNPNFDSSFSIQVTRNPPAKPDCLCSWAMTVANHRCLTCSALSHVSRQS